ncbi:unnamed protein product, partial [Polarella glacialis]
AMPLSPLHPSDPAADGSRWASMRTTLPEEWLIRYWFAWSIVAEAAALACAVVIVIICRSPKLRSQTFNKFVVFLALPDFVYSFLCGITCLLHALHGSWFGGDFMCNFQSFYGTFGIAASNWMNSLIAYELWRLASALAKAESYSQPSNRAIAGRIAGVNLFSGLLASVVVVPGLPMEVGAHSGLICLPMEYDLPSAMLHVAFTQFPVFWLPLLFIGWNFWRAYRVLAPNKAALNTVDRAIFVFFGRLLAVIVIFWCPSAVFLTIFPTNGHLKFYALLIGHFQALVSACFYMQKSDINAELRSTISSMASAVRGCWHRHGEAAHEVLRKSSLTAEMRERLLIQVQSEVLSHELVPMVAIEFTTWFQVGHFPHSSESLTRPVTDQDIVIFVSHRWSMTDSPDDVQGSKYSLLCRGVQKIVRKHKLDATSVVLWVDWGCISQEDSNLQELGISSLIAYAARADFMIVPVASDPASVCAFRRADHPTKLHNYGERAWCRLEVYIFMCMAEASRRPVFCYGCGPITLGNMCLPPLERLRSLFHKGAAFDMSMLPSTGDLSLEKDREVIHKIEEDMRDIYVNMAILEQKLNFETNTRLGKCILSEKQVRCIDVPHLVSAFVDDGLALRLRELHLDGNLISEEGAAVLMRDIVCNPQAALLTFLNLSGNPKLGAAGVKHIADGLANPDCALEELRLSRCDLSGDAVAPFTTELLESTLVRRLDLSYNCIDDRGCDGLLEACGGCDQPFLDLTVESNPLSVACLYRVSRARAAIGLGSCRARKLRGRSSGEGQEGDEGGDHHGDEGHEGDAGRRCGWGSSLEFPVSGEIYI